MEEKIRQYFEECESAKREPTAPGLCAALGLTMEELASLAESSAMFRSAIYRMADSLEQRHDANAKFLLRQRIYGGYSESPEDTEPVKVRIILEEERE